MIPRPPAHPVCVGVIFTHKQVLPVGIRTSRRRGAGPFLATVNAHAFLVGRLIGGGKGIRSHFGSSISRQTRSRTRICPVQQDKRACAFSDFIGSSFLSLSLLGLTRHNHTRRRVDWVTSFLFQLEKGQRAMFAFVFGRNGDEFLGATLPGRKPRSQRFCWLGDGVRGATRDSGFCRKSPRMLPGRGVGYVFATCWAKHVGRASGAVS